MDLKEFALKVKECRDAQKGYFRIAKSYTAKPSEKTAALDHSKRLEKELDEMTAAVLSTPQASQTNLFNEK